MRKKESPDYLRSSAANQGLKPKFTSAENAPKPAVLEEDWVRKEGAKRKKKKNGKEKLQSGFLFFSSQILTAPTPAPGAKFI